METNSTAPEAGPAPDDAKGDSATTGTGPAAAGTVGSAPTPNPDTTEFFDWFRRLGVPRRPGWLGGVCAGIGARLGIDPIIVRGIVVVAAVLGAPLVLLYAVAWLWLPDVDGEIHLERMLRGTVDPAIVGIAVMGVIGLISIAQGGWLGWRWWPDWPGLGLGHFDVFTPLRVLWVLIVVAGVIALVIWLARRAARTSPGGGDAARMASAPAAAAPGTAQFAPAVPRADGTASLAEPVEAHPTESQTDAAAATRPMAAWSGPDATTPTVEPPIPAEGADAAALAEWREQHEAWRRSREDWKRSQHDADRAAAAQAAAENKARAQELAARADEARRIRRIERPRASAAYVFTVFGIALVGAAISAIWALGAENSAGFAVPIAIAVAVIVLAVGMLVAAVRRRRSGALAFAATVATVAMFVAGLGAWIAPRGALVPPGYSSSLEYSQRLVQPFGDAYLYAVASGANEPTVIELTQGMGDTWLTLEEDARVVLDASAAGTLDVVVHSPDWSSVGRPQLGGLDRGRLVLGGDDLISDDPSGDVDARVVLTQRSGTVHIEIREGE